MVAIATPGTQRRAQLANFLNAIWQGVARAGDEIARHYREVGAQFVGHFHGAPYLRARHVAAEVNVAELHDGEAIERGIQVGNGNFLAANLILKAFGREAIHSAKERRGSGSGGSGTEKITSARIPQLFYTGRAGERQGRWRHSAGRLRMHAPANSGPQKIHTAH